MSKEKYRVTVRFSKEEWGKLNAIKEESGLAGSEYIRHVLFSNINKTAFEKRALWFLTRLYFSEKERSARDFDREKIDLLNEETEKQLRKWGY